MVDTVDEYEAGADFPIPELSTVEAGHNVLLVGPPAADPRSFGLRLIGGGIAQDQGVLVITLGGDAKSILEEYQSVADSGGQATVTVIDCSGTETPPTGLDERQYLSVQSPSSLTDIGISFVEYEDTHASRFVGTRVLVDSITKLLEHVPEDRAFEFISAFVGRFATAGHLGVWTMDVSAHDKQTVSTFEELFDVIVEFRKDEDTIEYRLRGRETESTEWSAVTES